MTKEFEMMPKPKKPSKPKPVWIADWDYSVSVKELMEMARELNDAYVEIHYADYGYTSIAMYAFNKPSETVYLDALKAYKDKYDAWDAWRIEHKEEIAKYKQKEKEKIAKDKKERNIAHLEKELEVWRNK